MASARVLSESALSERLSFEQSRERRAHSEALHSDGATSHKQPAKGVQVETAPSKGSAVKEALEEKVVAANLISGAIFTLKIASGITSSGSDPSEQGILEGVPVERFLVKRLPS